MQKFISFEVGNRLSKLTFTVIGFSILLPCSSWRTLPLPSVSLLKATLIIGASGIVRAASNFV